MKCDHFFGYSIILMSLIITIIQFIFGILMLDRCDQNGVLPFITGMIGLILGGFCLVRYIFCESMGQEKSAVYLSFITILLVYFIMQSVSLIKSIEEFDSCDHEINIAFITFASFQVMVCFFVYLGLFSAVIKNKPFLFFYK